MPELPEIAPGRLIPLLTRYFVSSRFTLVATDPRASYNELEDTLWMKAAGFTEPSPRVPVLIWASAAPQIGEEAALWAPSLFCFSSST
jgi:hypothetical protein